MSNESDVHADMMAREAMAAEITRLRAENEQLSDANRELRAENSDLKEGLHRYANGYQGSCYACEPVGMMNVALRAENERLRGERDTAWAELRGIREAINADPEESTLDEVRAVIYRLRRTDGIASCPQCEGRLLENGQLHRDVRELRAAIVPLKQMVLHAPHVMGCASLQGGPSTDNWGAIERCDCWKPAALAAIDAALVNVEEKS